jgi:hypothetical protein
MAEALPIPEIARIVGIARGKFRVPTRKMWIVIGALRLALEF